MTAPEQVVTWRRERPGVWVVTLDSPPANALGVPILDGLHAAIDAAERAGDVEVMIVTSALDGFFAAGADIRHMSSIDADSFMAYGDTMRAVNDRLARAPWVSIAAADSLAPLRGTTGAAIGRGRRGGGRHPRLHRQATALLCLRNHPWTRLTMYILQGWVTARLQGEQ